MCGLIFLAGAMMMLTGTMPLGFVLTSTLLWATAPAALSLAVLACRVADDSIDDPAYFSSIVEGLRSEWHRDSHAV